MGRHLGVGPIDLGVVEAGYDDGGLGVVRHDELGNAADRLEGAHMTLSNPVELVAIGRIHYHRSASPVIS
jgi:hypothetical protein